MALKHVELKPDGTLPDADAIRRQMNLESREEKVGHPDELLMSARKNSIAGLEIRTKSAGFLRLLQLSGSPFYHGFATEEDIDPFEIILCCFILTYPETDDLVAWAHEGTLRMHCDTWMSKNAEIEEVNQVAEETADWLKVFFEEHGVSNDPESMFHDEPAGDSVQGN